MPICAMMMALAHPAGLTLYGAKWPALANVLSVLAFYSAVFTVCFLFAKMVTGLGRTKFLLILQLVGLAPSFRPWF
jgi:O-antigen/teichoic acid export membrane protein